MDEEIKAVDGVISVYGPFEAYDFYIHERLATVKKMVISSARRSVQVAGVRGMDFIKFYHNGTEVPFKTVIVK